MTLKRIKFVTKEMMQADLTTLYVFGDNTIRMGTGGQAMVMRGEPNAVGIPTKRLPSMTPASFFRDGDLKAWKLDTLSDRLRLVLHKGDVVWPADGIGTGLAYLEQRAPAIWNEVQRLLSCLEDMHDQRNHGRGM